MEKTLDDYFCDWEGHNFGFGYGSGEPHVIPALKGFFDSLEEKRSYDYQKLEHLFTPLSAWLLINALCNADILEYGTSPRFGWLTSKGKKLRDYVETKTSDELVDLVCSKTEDYDPCYPDYCNCDGGENNRCTNPFWI